MTSSALPLRIQPSRLPRSRASARPRKTTRSRSGLTNTRTISSSPRRLRVHHFGTGISAGGAAHQREHRYQVETSHPASQQCMSTRDSPSPDSLHAPGLGTLYGLMDPLAHTLVAAALGRAVSDRRIPWAGLLGAIAGNAPDWTEPIVTPPFWTPRSGPAYLLYHRGITHSFAGAAVLIVGLTAVAGLLLRWLAARRGAAPPPWRWIAACVAAGVTSHLYLDWQGSYGVRPVLPLHATASCAGSARRPSGRPSPWWDARFAGKRSVPARIPWRATIGRPRATSGIRRCGRRWRRRRAVRSHSSRAFWRRTSTRAAACVWCCATRATTPTGDRGGRPRSSSCGSLRGGVTGLDSRGMTLTTPPADLLDNLVRALEPIFRLDDLVALSSERALYRAWDRLLKRPIALRAHLVPDGPGRAGRSSLPRCGPERRGSRRATCTRWRRSSTTPSRDRSPTPIPRGSSRRGAYGPPSPRYWTACCCAPSRPGRGTAISRRPRCSRIS